MVNINKLKELGVSYTPIEGSWIKEFYLNNIKINKEANNVFYSPQDINIDTHMLLKGYLGNKGRIDFQLDTFKDLYAAANKVVEVIQAKKRILLVTDYDCDGLTSAIVATRFFKDILKYENVDTLVNRRKYGNGLNSELTQEVIDNSEEEKVSLVITFDHASNDIKSILTWKTHKDNIETIVTDHHTVTVDLKTYPGLYLINPMREDNDYYKGISGCNTGFLLCVAIYKALGKTDLSALYPLLPYVAISLVVDQMPLYNLQTRGLIKAGINILNKREDESLVKLSNNLKFPKLLKNKNISWGLGPFFNSGNRCNTERTVFKGFTEKGSDIDQYLTYAITENNRRKRDQKEVSTDAIQQVYDKYVDLDNTYGLVVEIETDYGIAGPIASQVGEVFNRPTIVFRNNIDKTLLLGSGRAILDIDLLETLLEIQHKYPGLVYKAAGHSGACGIEIPTNKLEDFRKVFSDTIMEKLDSKLPKKELIITSYIEPKDISLALALQVESLMPFGNKWEEPIFLTKMKLKGTFAVGNNIVCNFFRIGNSIVSGLYTFNRDNGITRDNYISKLIPNDDYYIVFKINLGYFKNKYSLDITILDIIPETRLQGGS